MKGHVPYLAVWLFITAGIVGFACWQAGNATIKEMEAKKLPLCLQQDQEAEKKFLRNYDTAVVKEVLVVQHGGQAYRVYYLLGKKELDGNPRKLRVPRIVNENHEAGFVVGNEVKVGDFQGKFHIY